MITRNFHETMDLKPLFSHLLLSIVKIPGFNVDDLKSIAPDVVQVRGRTSVPDKGLDEDEDQDTVMDPCREKMMKRFLRRLYKAEENTQNMTEEMIQKKIDEYLQKRKHKYLKKLTGIARRITRKQLESLSTVEQRARFEIDLDLTCSDIKPNRSLDDGVCPKGGSQQKVTLTLNNNTNNAEQTSREFVIFSNRSYAKWNQIYLEIRTKKLSDEKKADPDGEDYHKAEFWLGYFDFPLVDNTFISHKERFAVILDSIDDKVAKISLLYFPASYAGFKEKSYYQHRIINTLLSKDAE